MVATDGVDLDFVGQNATAGTYKVQARVGCNSGDISLKDLNFPLIYPFQFCSQF